MLRCTAKTSLIVCLLSKPTTSSFNFTAIAPSTSQDIPRRMYTSQGNMISCFRNQSAVARDSYRPKNQQLITYLQQSIVPKEEEVIEEFEEIAKEHEIFEMNKDEEQIAYEEEIENLKKPKLLSVLEMAEEEGFITIREDPEKPGKLFVRLWFDDSTSSEIWVDKDQLYKPEFDELIHKLSYLYKDEETAQLEPREDVREEIIENMDNTIDKIVERKENPLIKERTEILQELIHLIKNCNGETPKKTLEMVLKMAKIFAVLYKISEPAVRFATFTRSKAKKDHEFIMASRELFATAFDLYKPETLSFPEVIQFCKGLIEIGLILNRDAFLYEATKWYLKCFKTQEAIAKWSENTVIDHCLFGGNLLFEHVLNPSFKGKEEHRQRLIRKIIESYEKLVPTTSAYAQLIVNLILFDQVEDAGILMSRFAIPGEEFIRPLLELTYEPQYCDVNLIHIAQFADLLIQCFLLDKDPPKKHIRQKYEVEEVHPNPDTGELEKRITQKVKVFITKDETNVKKFTGDGNIGFLFRDLRYRCDLTRKKLVNAGKKIPNLKKHQFEAKSFHKLVQEVANVWITLIEQHLIVLPNERHYAISAFEEFLNWRETFEKSTQNKKSTDEDPSSLHIDKLEDSVLKSRIRKLARQFKIL